MTNSALWTFSADGNGDWVRFSGHTKPLQLVATSTDWGGGTITLEASFDGGSTSYSVAGVSMTANGAIGELRLSVGESVRAVLSGATSPAEIKVKLVEVI